MPRGKSAIFSDKAGKKDVSCDNLTVKAVIVSVFRPLTRKRKPHFHHSISVFGQGIHNGAWQVLRFAKKPPAQGSHSECPRQAILSERCIAARFGLSATRGLAAVGIFAACPAYEPSPAGKALTANVRRATRGNRRPYFGVVFSARFSIGRNKKRRGKTAPPACSLPPGLLPDKPSHSSARTETPTGQWSLP